MLAKQGRGLVVLVAVACLLWLWRNAEKEEIEDAPADAELGTFATFNIEYFPRNQRQIEGAFALMAETGASVIAVQEITDPRLFEREAKKRLGSSWAFVFQSETASKRHPLHIGVLYDASSYQLEGTKSRHETRVVRGTQPSFQVALRERKSGREFVLVVVHFKARTEGRDLRQRQYEGLIQVVTELRRDERELLVMGDFNATEPDDRRDLETLSRRGRMHWSSEQVPCTSFWERRHDCPSSRLDQILSSRKAARVEARGACAESCERRDSCPVYANTISDHCPLVISF